VLKPTEIVDCVNDMDPGATVTEGFGTEVIVDPLIEALMVVAVPAKTPVKVAEYVPLVLSVTVLNVPVDVPVELEKVIVSPPVVRVLPAISFACTVTVIPEPEATEVVEAVMTEVTGLAGPGSTVTVGKVVITELPAIVALMVVAVPARAPVKVALYVPLLLSVVVPKLPVEDPPLFEKTTVEPPTRILFPAASLP
jgi:hypothetical protein